MEEVTKVKEALQEVYSRKAYFLLTLIFGLVVFSSNSFLRNYRLLLSDFSFSLLFNLIFTTHQSLPGRAFILLLIISLLGGIVFSFGFFLTRRQIKSGLGMGLSGVVVGILTPACPSCAVGLLSIVGLGGFLSILPFKGLELGALGIVILITSLVYLSRKITTNRCEIEK